MADSDITSLLSYLHTIEKMKVIRREIYCNDTRRKESDAEHSWEICMLIILLQKKLPEKLNIEKMLKMALMHDLVEVYAGDTFAFDENGRQTKQEREQKAFERLCKEIPEYAKEEFITILEEYEEHKTDEACYVYVIDKLQPLIQNIHSKGKSWKQHHLTYAMIDENKRKHMEYDKTILAFYERVLAEAMDKNLL